ncbi:DUF5825 family protein [Streptomyces xanthophaeus]|uniref:DUF5825 family protein n=1 Tax=Streptomyces xanthophaeus TaxID=67385 RepID=UPI002648F535|nr:DUF5825 family protein [Streptomyces xanthophaeus]WKD31925.1 hypothetical protein KO717_08170 [Streptomyces xanthophaeus]
MTGGQVVVDEPLPLGTGGRGAADAVRFLRDCQSRALTVRWVPDSDALPFDTGLLHHLPPPAPRAASPGGSGRSGSSDEAAVWRSRYAYGLLYHRRGPDFVTVMDRRDPAASARFTIDEPALLGAFLTVQEPTALDALDAARREAVSVLADERLVLVTQGWAVALPPRLRRWPVPCTSV